MASSTHWAKKEMPGRGTGIQAMWREGSLFREIQLTFETEEESKPWKTDLSDQYFGFFNLE